MRNVSHESTAFATPLGRGGAASSRACYGVPPIGTSVTRFAGVSVALWDTLSARSDTSAVDAQWHRMWLSRAGRLSCFSGEDSPLVGDAFQRLRPAVGEVDAGTGDEVFDGRGDEYLTGPRERAYTRADVHRDTREVIAS